MFEPQSFHMQNTNKDKWGLPHNHTVRIRLDNRDGRHLALRIQFLTFPEYQSTFSIENASKYRVLLSKAMEKKQQL